MPPHTYTRRHAQPAFTGQEVERFVDVGHIGHRLHAAAAADGDLRPGERQQATNWVKHACLGDGSMAVKRGGGGGGGGARVQAGAQAKRVCYALAGRRAAQLARWTSGVMEE